MISVIQIIIYINPNDRKTLNSKPEITEASCPGVSAVVAKELPPVTYLCISVQIRVRAR